MRHTACYAVVVVVVVGGRGRGYCRWSLMLSIVVVVVVVKVVKRWLLSGLVVVGRSRRSLSRLVVGGRSRRWVSRRLLLLLSFAVMLIVSQATDRPTLNVNGSCIITVVPVHTHTHATLQ